MQWVILNHIITYRYIMIINLKYRTYGKNVTVFYLIYIIFIYYMNTNDNLIIPVKIKRLRETKFTEKKESL